MIIEIVALQNLVNGSLLAGIWHSNQKALRRESLLRWKLGPKPMPLVDRLLEKRLVPKTVTTADRKKAKRIAGMSYGRPVDLLGAPKWSPAASNPIAT
jgi:hypothetical protein